VLQWAAREVEGSISSKLRAVSGALPRGILTLSNRPLTLRLHHLENEGVQTNINRDLIYSTTEAYLLNLLACHDNRIRYQPNSIRDEYDGRAQMAALTVMGAIYPYFVSRDLHHGPFVFSLTDLH